MFQVWIEEVFVMEIAYPESYAMLLVYNDMRAAILMHFQRKFFFLLFVGLQRSINFQRFLYRKSFFVLLISWFVEKTVEKLTLQG